MFTALDAGARKTGKLQTAPGTPRTSFPRPRNLLELTFDPSGLRPYIEDWETVAAGLLQRVRREALGLVIDDRLQSLLDKLQQ